MPSRNQKRRKKVVRYRRRKYHWNLGTITFGIIFIYLIINIIIYFNRESLSIYEVTQDTMQKTITTTGVVLRSEKLVKTKIDGFLNYYAQEGERVGKNDIVYSIDQSGKVHEYLSQTANNTEKFDTETYQKLKEIISIFNNYYDNNNFYEIYDFKYDLHNAIADATNDKVMKQLEKLLKEKGITDNYKKVASKESGIVSYMEDGYEKLLPKDITKEAFNQNNYKKKQLKNTEQIQAGSNIYKMITGNEWDMVIPLTKEQQEILKEKKAVNVNFLKDGMTLKATVTILENKDQAYAQLHFYDYMVRYLNNRFLTIEVVSQSVSGLKIPNTALVTRNLYRIPIAYLSEGSNSSTGQYFNVRQLGSDGEPTVKQMPANIIMKDDNYCYISTSDTSKEAITQGMILVRNDSNKTFKVSSTKAVEGVYCINKGFAAFKNVNVLHTNGDYSIVEIVNDPNALAIYDHIVLNSTTIDENAKIY